MDITVFTPTYNRGKELERTFNSLCKQTNMEFCWLIVDDGSTDDTAERVAKFKEKSNFLIEYIYQDNQGKPFAFNKGVDNTKTRYFFCIDSDDWLFHNAIEEILKKIDEDNKEHTVSGYVFQCLDESGVRITTKDFPSDFWMATFNDVQHVEKIKGDTAIIYDMNILKKHPFPKFEGEKFVPEALLFNRLCDEAPFYFFNTPIKYVEYLEDGFSANMSKLFYHNPRGYYQYCLEALNFPKMGFFEKLRHIAAVGVFGKMIKKPIKDSIKDLKKLDSWIYVCMLPAIFLYRIKE